MTEWRVLVEFQGAKVVLLAHIPTEEQQRGYFKNIMYPWSNGEIQMFVDDVSSEGAKITVRNLLSKYLQESA